MGQFGAAVESGSQPADFRIEEPFEAPTSFAAVDWLQRLQERARNRPIRGAITTVARI